ncbi:hypothetical protein Bca4012_014678 [Brassica carinata]
MGGGFFVADSGHGGEYEEGRVTAFVVVACIVAAMGGLLFGYDIGISGGVTSMEEFLTRFFPDMLHEMQNETGHETEYCKYDNELLTLFTSSLYLAALFASFLASTITRLFGRKVSMTIGGLAFLTGALLNGFAISLEMLIIGRLLLGVGVGFVNQAVPLYLSEMAPAKIRGALNMAFQLAITMGILAANIVNYITPNLKNGVGWRLSLGLAAVPASILLVGSFFLPETPNSILERGNKEEAKKMLQKIRGTVEVEHEFMDICMASTLVSIYSVDKFGRRALFLAGGIQMILTQFAVGSMIGWKSGLNGEGTLTSVDTEILLGLICLYVAGFAWSWGPLGWLVPSEICPLEIRSAGQSLNVSVNMFFTFLIGQFFVTMLCHMKFGLFYFFSVLVLIMTIFIHFLLPETKGVPIEEMARVWKDHRFWGKYTRVVDGGDNDEDGNVGDDVYVFSVKA